MLLLKLFNTVIGRENLKYIPLEDSTLYKVVTQTDTYCGRISYQDDVIMWLKTGGKPVKILKANIVRVSII